MAVAMRSNGLHHAVSLGTIEVSSKPGCSNQYDRSYDSEDENMSRRRLRHISSTELYPRTSVYSKGDIREQYCLTDRQLNTIERPRRERFFGCLSRRGTPQSFLGVCVGRRAPSDENLAAYAPFYKYPRYQHQYPADDKTHDSELDSSYFRRQPASILSTAKMSDTTSRYSWMGLHPSTNNENINYSQDPSSYHCRSHVGNPAVPPQSGPNTPRTKHVSFARSHTLTSFEDANLGFRSSGRLKTTRSQERLIGGKKPIIATGTIYEPTIMQQNAVPQNAFVGPTPSTMHQHQAIIHQHPHMHPHQHGHSHQHHHGPIHIHQFVPAYNTDLVGSQIQTEQPMSMLTSRPLMDDMGGIEMGVALMACPTQTLVPPSPEIVIVEKKFRNAMKTQATQTEVRKDEFANMLALSPRTIHKVKVVSQGAQTNGLQNGKKLTKSLSEMPNGQVNISDMGHIEQREMLDHGIVYRTQSEEPPRSPLESLQSHIGVANNISYYEPPYPMELSQYDVRQGSYTRTDGNIKFSDAKRHANTSVQSIATETHKAFNLCVNDSAVYDDSYIANVFDYESNSLPRRTCSHHRLENEFNSHSLPRRDPMHSHDICKHITECSELIGDSNVLDFTRPHLLPPPHEYCKDDDDNDEIVEDVTQQMKDYTDSNRRMSMVVIPQPDIETPFRRDDIRRQSMPVYVKTDKPSYIYATRSSHGKPSSIVSDGSEEKEIFIDFKPHVSPKRSPNAPQIYKDYNAVSKDEMSQQVYQKEECDACRSMEPVSSDNDDDAENEDPLYENIPSTMYKIPEIKSTASEKMESFRKRSVSLDEAGINEEKAIGTSAPPSPCREELLANVSTYPSSDSLANDFTRDHSDGIWNESQVTVLTAEQKDISEGSYNSNLLLTPSSKRKNLLLQHQQRSSVDTDALDFEEQFGDHSPTYSNTSMTKIYKVTTSTTTLPQTNREHKTSLSVPTKIITPSIAVTPSYGNNQQSELSSSNKSTTSSRRLSNNLTASPLETRKAESAFIQNQDQKNSEPNSYGGRSDTYKFNITNTDVSECSTNTDEYATCTDASKRTPGIKTPPTTTSSSSTTQVPVSTQSSQMDKTHGGSSFESASSLYSTRGEILSEDAIQYEEKTLLMKTELEHKLKSPTGSQDMRKKSPSHSISSTSSGSYNMAGLPVSSPVKDAKKSSKSNISTSSAVITSPVSNSSRDKTKIKPESVSDDERSEVRYSSSGYYESPHEEEGHIMKSRRNRMEEDRKRRKTSMKLDIEKENMRALTSPIKKQQQQQQAEENVSKEKSPEKQTTPNNIPDTSPNKIKRFRPKIRRQFRRSSRDDSTPRRQKNITSVLGLSAAGSSEKLLDSSMTTKPEPPSVTTTEQNVKVIVSPVVTVKSRSDTCQLKAKSIESLRSVSPGSDSVFYSEADGTGADPHSHCLHCGKEMEGQGSVGSALNGDSVESLPCIENENDKDIVKPPSDFADSPVATKTGRLYKKMDKRFRSEERYHGERGRHFKSRQENIRAKSEERGRENNVRTTHTLRPAGSSPCVLPDASSEQKHQIIYRGHYDPGRYTRLTDSDVWTQLDHQIFDRQRDRRASTDSEKCFHSKYQVILHRLVQRRCTLEMYHRQKNNTFQVDKTVVVKSDSGEFGFRIHGSKPVVVAAIEPDTPAESSGLEVGDIIISVNGIQVLDKHHTEVVKIAHDGCETLELQVARTIGVLMNEQLDPPSQPIYSGYLWRQSGQAKGSPDTKKWVRRWFCLRPDNCLYYYKTEDDTQPVGAMIMAKHTIEHCPPEIGKPFAFKVDSGEGIPMYVAADSEELSNRWINILKQSAVQGSPWLDKCARNLYQQPSSITRPDCFGYLMKLGSRWCGWSKRYCVLKDACLYFYQDANSKTAFGMACLHGYKVASMSTSTYGKKNSFEIIPSDSKLRHYFFCTESEMDKKRWISALEYSIDRWIKSG